MRKYYLDNLRFGIVVLVVVYHVLYIFNSIGVPTGFKMEGIPQLDVLIYPIYPWFMGCLFLIGGIGARYSLQKRTGKQFAKERVKKLLIPSTVGVLILGWTTGYLINLSTDIFKLSENNVPGLIKYFIYFLMGIGPLWFAQELFLVSMLLLLLRALDKKDKVWHLARKINIFGILFLLLVAWGSSYILNTPVITVYRHGFYSALFLMGYYVFSHEHVQDLLEKWHLPLLITALVLGVAYTIHYYGQDYTSDACLQSLFTNTYAYVMTLAIIGCSKAWFSSNTKFTRYMAPRSFGIYVLHYPVMAAFAYFITTYNDFPKVLNYILLLVCGICVVPLCYEIVSRVPVVRALVLGKYNKSKKQVATNVSGVQR